MVEVTYLKGKISRLEDWENNSREDLLDYIIECDKTYNNLVDELNKYHKKLIEIERYCSKNLVCYTTLNKDTHLKNVIKIINKAGD